MDTDIGHEMTDIVYIVVGHSIYSRMHLFAVCDRWMADVIQGILALFDVDGTLTEARKVVSPETISFLQVPCCAMLRLVYSSFLQDARLATRFPNIYQDS